jgi:hypothetical protein
VEEILDPQLVGLRDARKREEGARQLGEHVNSLATAAKDGPQDLDAAYNIQTPYLPSLKMIDTVIENLANVWAILLGRK